MSEGAQCDAFAAALDEQRDVRGAAPLRLPAVFADYLELLDCNPSGNDSSVRLSIALRDQ